MGHRNGVADPKGGRRSQDLLPGLNRIGAHVSYRLPGTILQNLDIFNCSRGRKEIAYWQSSSQVTRKVLFSKLIASRTTCW